MLVLIGIVILLTVLVNLTPVQNYLAQRTVGYLSEKLHTKVSVKHVRLDFFNHADLQGLYIQDQWHDTLLYAGEAQIKITDWFFFKEKPELSYLSLKDAYVNLYRTQKSDIWNYSFALDAFKGDPGKSDGQNDLPEWNLKKIRLENVRFHSTDKWVGNDMVYEVGKFTLNANNIDFDKKEIRVDAIIADKVVIGLRDYKSSEGYHPKKRKKRSIDTTAFNPGQWKVSVNELKLSDSRFFLDDPDSRPAPGEFDPWHIDIRRIRINADKININADTITGKVKMLQAKERSGIEIRKMVADVKVSPKISECKNLLLQTNRSTIRDYYAMVYDRFPDFDDYVTKVKMIARLHNSKVAMQDIIYFAPYGLERFHAMLATVNGEAQGTVSSLKAQNININDDANIINGDVSIEGLPDIDTTMITFDNGKINTNAKGFFAYFPELQDNSGFDVSSLGSITFDGSFRGFYNDFNVKGNIATALGTVTEDVQLQFGQSISDYSGNIKTQSFDLGKFLKQEHIGTIALDMDIRGKGFDPQTANVEVNGRIPSFVVNDYDYKNTEVKGVLQRKEFTGNIHTGDTNLKMDFDGRIDYSQETPLFDFTSDIVYLNAKQLHFTNQNIYGSGKASLHFTGSNIDNFTGSALLNELHIRRDSTELNLDAIQLTSSVDTDGDKVLSLSGSGLQAALSGRFSILGLPQAFQLFLSYYIPEYVNAPAQIDANQKFNFRISTVNTDGLLALFSPELRVAAGAAVNGSFDMLHQKIDIQGTIPAITYGNNMFNDITLDAHGSNSGLHLQTDVSNMQYLGNDITSASLHASLFQDTAKFNIITHSSRSIGNAELNGMAYANNDSFYIGLLPSEFYIDNHRWELAAGNEAVLSKDYLWLRNWVFRSDSQSVTVNTLRNPEPNNAVVLLKNVDIGFLNGFIKDEAVSIGGSVTGRVAVQPLLGGQHVAFDMAAPQFLFNHDTLGILKMSGNYNVGTSTLHIDQNSGITKGEAGILANGDWNFKSNSDDDINANITLQEAPVSIVQPFLNGLLNNIGGTVSGNINVSCSTGRIATQGKAVVHGITFTPDITGVHYHIKDGTLNISDNDIDVGNMTMYDEQDNTGTITGNVTHHNLRDFEFHLRLNSNKIQVMNLSKGTDFYGDVIAAVQMRLTGPVDDINIAVSGTPLKNSKLYIPVSNGIDLGDYDYIHFKSKDESDGLDRSFANKSSYHVRIDAVATPDIECYIILDPATGDQIWARGNGNFILDIPSSGNMRLNGNYVIEEGKYDFAFKQLQVLNYRRQFAINKGSVIKWNGNIDDADLDVSAVAQVQARLYDLISNEITKMDITSSEIRDAQIKQPVNVMMNMQGSLQNPQFSFRIGLAENHSIGTYAYQRLQRVNTDEKELLNQVASLLLIDQFLPPEGFNSSSVSTGTINNMSEVASTFASSQLTNFTNKVLGLQNVYVGIQYKNYNLNNPSDPLLPEYITRNEAGIDIRKNFFNDRLIVEVGGVYDWGRATSQNQLSANLAGDFRIQYLLNEDGRIRLNVFRTSDYDPLYFQNINRQGVGLMYRKSFNSLYDFFHKDDSRRKQDKNKKGTEQEQHAILEDSTLSYIPEK